MSYNNPWTSVAARGQEVFHDRGIAKVVLAALTELFEQNPVEQSAIRARLSQPYRRQQRAIANHSNMCRQARRKALNLARQGKWSEALYQAKYYCALPAGTVDALMALLV